MRIKTAYLFLNEKVESPFLLLKCLIKDKDYLSL